MLREVHRSRKGSSGGAKAQNGNHDLPNLLLLYCCITRERQKTHARGGIASLMRKKKGKRREEGGKAPSRCWTRGKKKTRLRVRAPKCGYLNTRTKSLQQHLSSARDASPRPNSLKSPPKHDTKRQKYQNTKHLRYDTCFCVPRAEGSSTRKPHHKKYRPTPQINLTAQSCPVKSLPSTLPATTVPRWLPPSPCHLGGARPL